MCGIIGLTSGRPVNQRVYDALLLLQHRGQDAAGIATVDETRCFHIYKAMGLVRDVFRTRNMRDLLGNAGIGHVRYPPPGCASSVDQSQPFYVNAPYGIMFAHNGNLTNAPEVARELYEQDHRHINTTSDSEVLLNVFADELGKAVAGSRFSPEAVFAAVRGVHRRVKGAYAVVALIAGRGMVGFRDPCGIRPLGLGRQAQDDGSCDYMLASESVAMIGTEFEFMRDVAPGEAVFIDNDRRLHAAQCAENPRLSPCAFEYVYFARPDSVVDGISVYDARLRLGEYLAAEVAAKIDVSEIDCVMPIPDSARPAAQQLAAALKISYREGFIKNRYMGRTFIMPGQAIRKQSVRQKLNPMPVEFRNKSILLVDDSIVRGTTMREIVRMARDVGAKKIYVASSAPRVMFPNVYGIDMPTRSELICGRGESDEDVARQLGADGVVFQPLDGLTGALTDLNPAVGQFDCSCFDGVYVTGDIDEAYLQRLEASRNGG
ncbi:MAG: amidophosphoribosyltransferase [Duodenibacillus sp.]|nr:amidophosphoribosyltransferase [Duodenibacillus sp.]